MSPANRASRRAAKSDGFGEADEGFDNLTAQMGLGEVEADARFLDDQPGEAIGLVVEQLAKGRRPDPLQRCPCLVGLVVPPHRRSLRGIAPPCLAPLHQPSAGP